MKKHRITGLIGTLVLHVLILVFLLLVVIVIMYFHLLYLLMKKMNVFYLNVMMNMLTSL